MGSTPSLIVAHDQYRLPGQCCRQPLSSWSPRFSPEHATVDSLPCPTVMMITATVSRQHTVFCHSGKSCQWHPQHLWLGGARPPRGDPGGCQGDQGGSENHTGRYFGVAAGHGGDKSNAGAADWHGQCSGSRDQDCRQRAEGEAALALCMRAFGGHGRCDEGSHRCMSAYCHDPARQQAHLVWLAA
jgi:hypothetical protein